MRLIPLSVIALVIVAATLRLIWLVVALDVFFVAFYSTMLVSRRARYAFADWLDRKLDG